MVFLAEEELQDLKKEIFHHKLKMAELEALIDKERTLEERGKLPALFSTKEFSFCTRVRMLKVVIS